MTDNPTFEKIEAWLSGELAGADAHLFEAEIAANPELAAEVERHRRGRLGLDRLVEQDLRTDFAAWRETLDQIPPPPDDAALAPDAPAHRLKRFFWLGGLILLLVLAGVVWRRRSSSPQAPEHPTLPVLESQQGPVATTNPEKPRAVDGGGGGQAHNSGGGGGGGYSTPIEYNTATPSADSRQLIALADTRLANLRSSIIAQLDETRGIPNETAAFGPDFSAGQKAFRNGDYGTARETLLRVTPDHSMFAYAQEMLAWIAFRNKDYPTAVACYETYTGYDTGAHARWRLTLFYLADYEHQQAKFWNALDGIIAPATGSIYRQSALELQRELRKQGVLRK